MRRPLDLLADRRVYLPRHEALAELRADIVRAAYVEGDFTLTGGLRRSYYFDKYLFETRPALLRRLSRFLADLVPQGTDRLAAPALGAVALGTAVSLELGLPLVIVRPESGQVGSQHPMEGELYAGEEVTLIEDVVVTGTRAMRAVSRLGDVGAKAGSVVAVLDRLEGAAERFADASIRYYHLFTPEELGISEPARSDGTPNR
jgi:orotate phosphoribosyltransferase